MDRATPVASAEREAARNAEIGSFWAFVKGRCFGDDVTRDRRNWLRGHLRRSAVGHVLADFLGGDTGRLDGEEPVPYFRLERVEPVTEPRAREQRDRIDEADQRPHRCG